jgi:hypothetical protein
MIRRLVDAVSLLFAGAGGHHVVSHGARLWLSWRTRPRGPVDESLIGRLLAVADHH